MTILVRIWRVSTRFAAAVILTWIAALGSAGNVCDKVNPIAAEAYIGWPFHLDCTHLIDMCKRHNTNVNLQLANTNCSVTEDSVPIQPELHEFSHNVIRTFNLTMACNETQCLTSLMTVRISPFPNVTCEEFLKESRRNGDIVKYEATEGHELTLYSCPYSNQVNVVSSALSGENFETVWMWSCSPHQEDTYRSLTIKNEANENGCADNLQFGNVEFFDGGEFVSSVRYKDKTLFVSSRSVCVKRNVIDERPSGICSPVERYAAGETGVLHCEATVPNGVTLPGELLIEWLKGSTRVCSNSDLNQRVDNGKHSCSTEGSNNPIACVYNDQDKDAYTKKISLRLEIRGLAGNDFGQYTLKITYRGSSAEKSSSLSEDLAPFFKRLAIILGLLFLVIAAIVIAILYYKRNTLEVRLRWMKLRGYQKKGRMVYLSYYYDRFSMDNEEQNMINVMVEAISSEADCYDINRDGMPGSPVAEYVPTEMLKCHTTVLVITSRFIECAERQFDSEQAFGQLLALRKQMIIIVTPDGVQALQRRDLDSVWSNISLAVKIIGAFYWKNDKVDNVRNLKQFIRKRIERPRSGIRFLMENQETIFYENNNNTV